MSLTGSLIQKELLLLMICSKLCLVKILLFLYHRQCMNFSRVTQ